MIKILPSASHQPKLNSIASLATAGDAPIRHFDDSFRQVYAWKANYFATEYASHWCPDYQKILGAPFVITTTSLPSSIEMARVQLQQMAQLFSGARAL